MDSPTAPKHSSADRPRLVLVDDDRALRHALTFAFETDGYAVTAFEDGERMLERKTQDVSCYVLDVNLPGTSGIVALERLRGSGEAAPAILITTHPSATTRKKARELGAVIVEKPLLGDTLRRAVAILLEN